MSGTYGTLHGVACLSLSPCVAVGGIIQESTNSGTILRCTDGGRTWRRQPSGSTNDLGGMLGNTLESVAQTMEADGRWSGGATWLTIGSRSCY